MSNASLLDYQRAAVALLRSLLAGDHQGAEAITDSTDPALLLLSIAAVANGVGTNEAGSVEAWDAYLAARLAELPPG
jgi:hypothetical protein